MGVACREVWAGLDLDGSEPKSCFFMMSSSPSMVVQP